MAVLALGFNQAVAQLRTTSTSFATITSPPLRGVVIFVQNRSLSVTEIEVVHGISAVQKQLDEHVFPVWGKSAELRVVGDLTVIPEGSPRLYIESFTDTPGLAGYHRLESSNPTAKVFINTIAQAGMSWSSVVSHELLEMLFDPNLDECVQTVGKDSRFIFILREICDPVTSHLYAYEIDGVRVSNFVYPSWFRRGGAFPYDHQRVLQAPLTLGRNGYAYVYNVYLGIGWKEIDVDP